MPGIRAREHFTPSVATSRIDYDLSTSRYLLAGNFVQGKFVLDVACGTGYSTNYFAEKGPILVVGMDRSRKAIETAATFRARNLEFLRGDAHYLPFKAGVYDVVVSLETIEHLTNQSRFLSEVKRVLRVPSMFLCSTPAKEASFLGSEKSLNPYHVKELYIEEFAELLNRFFERVQLLGLHQISPAKVVLKRFGGIGSRFILKSPFLIRLLLSLAEFVPQNVVRKSFTIDAHMHPKPLSDGSKPYLLQKKGPIPVCVVALAEVVSSSDNLVGDQAPQFQSGAQN